MLKVHLISDLFLDYNEFSMEEEVIPDVDLCVINGNIGFLKRSMLFAETLCKKYPKVPFVINLGETEAHQYTKEKFVGETLESMNIRQLVNESKPSNLNWSTDPMIITCKNGAQVDILCSYGYPYIYSTNTPWAHTNWHRYYKMAVDDTENPSDRFWKPKDTSNVRHGTFPIMATKEYINSMHEIEYNKVKTWEITNSGNYYKILVTHINPYVDTRLSDQKVGPYNIHMSDKYWLSSNTKMNGINFLGGKLYANPGRGLEARTNVITIG